MCFDFPPEHKAPKRYQQATKNRIINKNKLIKKYITILTILFSIFSYSQKENQESTTRKFIEKAQFKRINKDWSTIAEFKSGIGEYVNFYPIEVIDLKSNEKVNALQLDMFIKNPDTFKTVWVGIDEVEEFITFVEKNVIPNLNLKFKDKSTEFIFTAKEMTFSYFVYEKDKKITIKLNSYDNPEILNYTFWTETQVDKIPKLLEVLKKIK
ncbi:hypothetical protein K5L04_07440 [Flavobacterium psychrophilum]|uniref:hypothetical protein n=2 Tax=Flavobacterium TaxID=237 RepID=UPI001C8F66CB|nr:hypothetical protein [Flavobacterium psychrophilum]EKT4520678.1 hypothetical protein [Flavobacterium psychrophilum]EKT4550720.1 hypothetical protein [Flavobacterium psychrophilum]ELI6456056.1 hypothetical protein [Flavobacterium psychrophilum]ELY2011341.1 hypothetical protein [Flavobacterium psychrophilum]MCB6089523.1 hypothetical protein [Flavobacterium psychrophilum]